jgi:alkylation response protein AidB-like acyl-CoA dehydrogenase
VGKRLLEICSEYAKTWETFGKTLSEQTRVHRLLADLATDIQATRLMVYHAAFVADKGGDIRREAAMVKIFATEMLHRAVDKTVQIHGGPAYAKGLFIEKLCRNTVEAKFIEETIALQRYIIARDILRGTSFH